MKTKLFYFLMVFILIGMVIPSFAITPKKDNGNKSKTETLTPPPPSPWQLNIQVVDACDTCAAMYSGCTIGFYIQHVSTNCIAVNASPYITPTFNYCQSSYSYSIPDSIPCVQVSLIFKSGGCNPNLLNTYTCCKCRGDSTPCKLRICP
jgi:hypothetical protein